MFTLADRLIRRKLCNQETALESYDSDNSKGYFGWIKPDGQVHARKGPWHTENNHSTLAPTIGYHGDHVDHPDKTNRRYTHAFSDGAVRFTSLGTDLSLHFDETHPVALKHAAALLRRIGGDHETAHVDGATIYYKDGKPAYYGDINQYFTAGTPRDVHQQLNDLAKKVASGAYKRKSEKPKRKRA